MSKATPGSFRDFHFWVFDVCQGLVFAEMIGVIEAAPAPPAGDRADWLARLLPDLRLHAAINDVSITVDEWADGHEDAFVDLVAQARDRLIARGTVTPEEAAAWIVLDDLPIHWRGSETVSTADAVEFAEALMGIVRGTYPAAPAGRQWYFGGYAPDGGIATIEVRS